MEEYVLVWAPEGRVIAVVKANSHKEAKKQIPKPYSRYKGEVYAQLRSDREKEIDHITELRKKTND